ncbi:MAG TPA: archease [Candidatus Aquicultor sp.]|jgi:SHS2 domain-containing protein
MQAFEILDHTADVGLRAYGHTLKEVFENIAVGMFSLITDLDNVKSSLSEEIEIEAEDREDLLVEWLNELLYQFEVRYKVFKRVNIVDWDEEHRLRAIAYGEPLDLGRHQIKTQIKATSYHMLKVEYTDGIWSAQVIFDV